MGTPNFFPTLNTLQRKRRLLKTALNHTRPLNIKGFFQRGIPIGAKFGGSGEKLPHPLGTEISQELFPKILF